MASIRYQNGILNIFNRYFLCTSNIQNCPQHHYPRYTRYLLSLKTFLIVLIFFLNIILNILFHAIKSYPWNCLYFCRLWRFRNVHFAKCTFLNLQSRQKYKQFQGYDLMAWKSIFKMILRKKMRTIRNVFKDKR